MARLEAKAKLLYYPTPDGVTASIASWFKASPKPRLVDPCCGTGAALAGFAKALDVTDAQLFGIELSYKRAEEAAIMLDAILPVDFYRVYQGNWSYGSTSLIFNNPPYDWSDYCDTETENGLHPRVRHELLFVENCTRRLVSGGHHVIIIPRGILGDPAMTGRTMKERFARHVLGWYEDVKIYRFPDGEYERFKQVVVLACKKRDKYVTTNKEAIEGISALANTEMEIPILANGNGEYVIPPAPASYKFQYTPQNPQDLIRAAEKCNPVGEEFHKATYVRPLGAPFQPAMPISLGHVTMMITGQETGVVRLMDNDRKVLLVKGMSQKIKTHVADNNYDHKGNVTSVSVTEREINVATLTTVNENGDTDLLSSAEDVGNFVTTHANDLSAAILGKNKPLYDYQPTRNEWAVASRAALGLPPLPGRTEKGLFEVQKHFAIALSRVLKKQGSGILNCEMGWGKSSSSIASLMVFDKWPTIMVVPGHMIWKWSREFTLTSDPDSLIVPRVITRPILKEPGRWPGLKEAIQEAGGMIIETRRWQVEPTTPNDPGGRRYIKIACAPSRIGDITRLLKPLSFRDKDCPAITPQITSNIHGIEVEYVDKDHYTLADFVNDYRTGVLGQKAVAIVAFDPAKYDAGAVDVRLKVTRPEWVEDEKVYKKATQYICPTCGQAVKGSPRFCKNIVADNIINDGKVEMRECVCNAPLFEMSNWRRVGAARLIQKKYKHFFKAYLIDEAHKTQNGRSDLGCMDQRLISSTRYNIALTGTIFGGSASSLFYLLFRRVPEIRKLYSYDDYTRWVDHYGLWERRWDQAASAGDYGKSTNIQRWNVRSKELPGISPAVIRYLLPITLFGNITDLGYDLPPVHEVVETLEMLPEQISQYQFIEKEILKEAMHCLQEGDPGAVSPWFSACRFRPASAFRMEHCSYSGKESGFDFPLPAVVKPGEWLPKEVRLAQIVAANISNDRKTLVFVEQSGTRDIRGRLDTAVKGVSTPGQPVLHPRVGILSSDDMEPARREAWIKANVPKLDVLIVNPKLVETGLDLVMFSDLVFYETTLSLYVLWQAMRRVWRLGQSKEVFVTFLAYANTVEEEILRRMGAKKKAAQLLYGKEAAGVLVETDSDDIRREMIKAAINGESFKFAGKLAGVFTDGSERMVSVTHSPSGSLVAASPLLPVAADPILAPDIFNIAPMQFDLFGGLVEVKQVLKKRKFS